MTTNDNTQPPTFEELIPDEPCKPRFDIGGRKILLHGLPKIGKSSLTARFPGAVFLPTEPGLDSIEHFQIPAQADPTKPPPVIGTWADFGKACVALKSEKARSRFRTVIVDTVDQMYFMCERFVCGQLGIKAIAEASYGIGTSRVATEFRRVLFDLSALGYGVIFTSHTQVKEFEEPGGRKYNRLVPTLPDRARALVAGLVDMILCYSIEQVTSTGTDGTVTAREARTIRCRPGRGYDAGDRTRTLPEVIIINDGTPEAAYNALLNAHQQGLEAIESGAVPADSSVLLPVSPLETRARFTGDDRAKKK